MLASLVSSLGGGRLLEGSLLDTRRLFESGRLIDHLRQVEMKCKTFFVAAVSRCR